MTKKVVAVPSGTDKGLNALIQPIFGRSKYFTVVSLVDDEIDEVTILENPAVESQGGAAIKTLNLLAEEKIDVVISSHYGPNAAAQLEKSKINFYLYPGDKEQISIKDIIGLYTAGKLSKAKGPNVDTYHGMNL